MYIYQDDLQSERLTTRFLTSDDIKPWTDFFNDKEAVELFPDNGMATNEEKAKFWIDKTLNRYKENKFGLQKLIYKSTNEFVGQCGLMTQEVDGINELEVGYHIFKKYWGQGFAPEAARLFIDYAFDNSLSGNIISIIDKRNIKSQRVADKNGLIKDKETSWNNLEVYIYRIKKEDWR